MGILSTCTISELCSEKHRNQCYVLVVYYRTVFGRVQNYKKGIGRHVFYGQGQMKMDELIAVPVDF